MDPLGLPKACLARLTVFEVGCSLESLTCASPVHSRSPSGDSDRAGSGELNTSPARHHPKGADRTRSGAANTSPARYHIKGASGACIGAPNTTPDGHHLEGAGEEARVERCSGSSASASQQRLCRSATQGNKLAAVATDRNARTPRVASLRHGGGVPNCETPVPAPAPAAMQRSSRKASGATPQSAASVSATYDSSNKENSGRGLPKSAARVHDLTRYRKLKRAPRRRDLSMALASASRANGASSAQPPKSHSGARRPPKSRSEARRRLKPRARMSSLDMLSVSSSPRVSPSILPFHPLSTSHSRHSKKVKRVAEVSRSTNIVIRLPGDLRTSVFAWLSVDDLSQSAQVCHLWRNETSKPVLWREHCRRLAAYKTSRRPLKPLSLQALQLGNGRLDNVSESSSPKGRSVAGSPKRRSAAGSPEERTATGSQERRSAVGSPMGQRATVARTPKDRSASQLSAHEVDATKSAPPPRSRFSSSGTRTGRTPAISALVLSSTTPASSSTTSASSSTTPASRSTTTSPPATTDWKRAYRLRAKRLKTVSDDNKLKRSSSSWLGTPSIFGSQQGGGAPSFLGASLQLHSNPAQVDFGSLGAGDLASTFTNATQQSAGSSSLGGTSSELQPSVAAATNSAGSFVPGPNALDANELENFRVLPDWLQDDNVSGRRRPARRYGSYRRTD